MVDVLIGLMFIGMLVASSLLWWRLYKAEKNQERHALSARDIDLPPLGFIDLVAVFIIQIVFQSVGGMIVFALTNTIRT